MGNQYKHLKKRPVPPRSAATAASALMLESPVTDLHLESLEMGLNIKIDQMQAVPVVRTAAKQACAKLIADFKQQETPRNFSALQAYFDEKRVSSILRPALRRTDALGFLLVDTPADDFIQTVTEKVKAFVHERTSGRAGGASIA